MYVIIENDTSHDKNFLKAHKGTWCEVHSAFMHFVHLWSDPDTLHLFDEVLHFFLLYLRNTHFISMCNIYLHACIIRFSFTAYTICIYKIHDVWPSIEVSIHCGYFLHCGYLHCANIYFVYAIILQLKFSFMYF